MIKTNTAPVREKRPNGAQGQLKITEVLYETPKI